MADDSNLLTSFDDDRRKKALEDQYREKLAAQAASEKELNFTDAFKRSLQENLPDVARAYGAAGYDLNKPAVKQGINENAADKAGDQADSEINKNRRQQMIDSANKKAFTDKANVAAAASLEPASAFALQQAGIAPSDFMKLREQSKDPAQNAAAFQGLWGLLKPISDEKVNNGADYNPKAVAQVLAIANREFANYQGGSSGTTRLTGDLSAGGGGLSGSIPGGQNNGTAAPLDPNASVPSGGGYARTADGRQFTLSPDGNISQGTYDPSNPAASQPFPPKPIQGPPAPPALTGPPAPQPGLLDRASAAIGNVASHVGYNPLGDPAVVGQPAPSGMAAASGVQPGGPEQFARSPGLPGSTPITLAPPADVGGPTAQFGQDATATITDRIAKLAHAGMDHIGRLAGGVKDAASYTMQPSAHHIQDRVNQATALASSMHRAGYAPDVIYNRLLGEYPDLAGAQLPNVEGAGAVQPGQRADAANHPIGPQASAPAAPPPPPDGGIQRPGFLSTVGGLIGPGEASADEGPGEAEIQRRLALIGSNANTPGAAPGAPAAGPTPPRGDRLQALLADAVKRGDLNEAARLRQIILQDAASYR